MAEERRRLDQLAGAAPAHGPQPREFRFPLAADRWPLDAQDGKAAPPIAAVSADRTIADDTDVHAIGAMTSGRPSC